MDYSTLIRIVNEGRTSSDLQGPAETAVVREKVGAPVLTRSLLAEETPASASAPVDTVHPAAVSRPEKARVIAFTSGMMGGTGKSTLAGTLAWLLAHEGGVPTLLLALDAPPSAVTHFKLARWPHLGLFLAGEAPFERVLQRQGALTVGVAPGDPVVYDKIGALTPAEPEAVLRVVNVAATQFDLLVADLPSAGSGWAVHPLLVADVVLLVARSTVADQAGVVQALTLLQGLRRDRGTPIHLVLNDRGSRDLSPKDFLAGVEQVTPCPPPVVTLPHSEAVRLAQNEGVPLPLAAGTDEVVRAVRRLAACLGYQLQAEEGELDAVELPKSGPDRQRGAVFAWPRVQIRLTD